MHACRMRLVFILYLNIEEISQTKFKFMGAGMLNTEVKSPGQTVILGSQGQTIISKKTNFKKNNKTFIIFEVWVRSGGVFLAEIALLKSTH